MFTEDKTKYYFFYNVYGDAEELLSTKPENVIAIPFGWSEEVENYRNEVLNILDANVSTLPSLLFWGTEFTTINLQEQELVHPAKWEEVRVLSLEKPWNWNDINEVIETFFESPVDGVPNGIVQ
jgi:hypothetical protein